MDIKSRWSLWYSSLHSYVSLLSLENVYYLVIASVNIMKKSTNECRLTVTWSNTLNSGPAACGGDPARCPDTRIPRGQFKFNYPGRSRSDALITQVITVAACAGASSHAPRIYHALCVARIVPGEAISTVSTSLVVGRWSLVCPAYHLADYINLERYVRF